MNVTSALSRRMVTLVVVAIGLLAAGCGPRVFIDAPTNGTFTTASTVTVNGHVVNGDPAAITLHVNGAAVPLAPDGTFTTNLPLDPALIYNPITADIVQAGPGRVDSDRVVVIAGDSVQEGDFSDKAIALHINNSGLDALEPVVSGLVDLDIATLMPVGTVVTNDPPAKITSPSPSISDFKVDFAADQDQVNAVISLHDFKMTLDVTAPVVGHCNLKLTADSVAMTGAFSLAPDAMTPSKVDVTQVGDVTTTFVGFNHDFTTGACSSVFLEWIVNAIVGDVQALVRGGFEGFLNTPDASGNTVISAAIEGALAGVDIAGPVGQALNAQLEAPLFKVDQTTGGVTLGADARFVTHVGTGPGECTPPAGAPHLTASYHVAQPFPSFGATAPNGQPYDVGLGISTSGFNQLLRSMVECGLLVTSIGEIDLLGTGHPIPLTAGLLSAFIPQLQSVDPTLPARIDIAPTLAPLVTGAPGPKGELALLKISQLLLKVVIDNPNGGELEAVRATLDADVGINLDVDPVGGALVFELAPPDPSTIKVKVVETPIGANLTNLETLLPSLVGSFLPALASGLGSFPLPQFLGLSLDVVQVARNGEMLTIYANLSSGQPCECVAPAGIQYYDIVSGHVAYGGNLYNPTLVGGEFDGLKVSEMDPAAIMGMRANASSDMAFLGADGASFYDDTTGNFAGAFNPTLTGGTFDGRPVSDLSPTEILGVTASPGWELVLLGAQGVQYYNLTTGAFRGTRNPTLSGGDYAGVSVSAIPSTMFLGAQSDSTGELIFMGPSGINYYNDNGSLQHIFNPLLVGGEFDGRHLADLLQSEVAGILNVSGGQLALFRPESQASCTCSGTGIQFYDEVTGEVAYNGGMTDSVLSGGEFNGKRLSELDPDSIMDVRRQPSSEIALLGAQGVSFYDDNTGALFGTWNPTLTGGPFDGRKVSDLLPSEVAGVTTTGGWELMLMSPQGLSYYDHVTGQHRLTKNSTLSGGDFDGLTLGQVPSSALVGGRDASDSELVFMGPSGLNFYDDDGPLHHVFNPILVGGAFSARRVSSLHPSEIMGIMNVWHAGLVLRKAQ